MTAVLTKWIFYKISFVFLLFIHSMRKGAMKQKRSKKRYKWKGARKMKNTHAAYLHGLNWKPLLKLLSIALRLLTHWQIIVCIWCVSFHWNCNQFMPWFVHSMNAFFFQLVMLAIYSGTKIVVDLFNKTFDERFNRIFRTAINQYNWPNILISFI